MYYDHSKCMNWIHVYRFESLLESNMLVVFVLNLKTVFPKQKQRPKINAPRLKWKACNKVPLTFWRICAVSAGICGYLRGIFVHSAARRFFHSAGVVSCTLWRIWQHSRILDLSWSRSFPVLLWSRPAAQAWSRPAAQSWSLPVIQTFTISHCVDCDNMWSVRAGSLPQK